MFFVSNELTQALSKVIHDGSFDFLDSHGIDRSYFLRTDTDEMLRLYDFLRDAYDTTGQIPTQSTIQLFLDDAGIEFIFYENLDADDAIINSLRDKKVYNGFFKVKMDINDKFGENSDSASVLAYMCDSFGQILDETVDDSVAMMDSEVAYIEVSDPISYLDTGIEGVSLRSEDAFLSIIAGTGIGKTWVMCKIAVDLAKSGKKVLLVSEELPKRAVVERLYAYYRHVSISDVEKKIVKIVPDTGLQIGILDHSLARYTYVSDISAKLRTFKPDVVLIDDISYMSPDSVDTSKMQPYQRISEAIYQLIILQHRSKIPFITTMQFNRAGGAAEIKTLYDVSGSIDSVTKSPTVIILDRKKDKKDTIFMIVDKERYGDDGKRILKYKVDYSTCTWTFDGYVDEEELSVEELCDEAMNQKKIVYDWHNRSNYFTHQDVVDGKADGFSYIKGKYPDGKEISTQPEKVRKKLINQFNYKPSNIF